MKVVILDTVSLGDVRLSHAIYELGRNPLGQNVARSRESATGQSINPTNMSQVDRAETSK